MQAPIPPKKGTGGGPVAVICYICGRQYGTRSIQIHQAQCIKKWEKENAELPPSQRRTLPEKPKELTRISPGKQLEQQNQIAFDLYQKQLVPCSQCGRTFQPDRLEVHMRSCKKLNPIKNPNITPLPSNNTPNRSSNASQRTNTKKGLSASVTAQAANSTHVDKQPHRSQTATFSRNYKSKHQLPSIDATNANISKSKNSAKVSQRTTSASNNVRQKIPRKPKTLICYICGREFGTTSLAIHEPQCLEKWKIENSKLPKSQRRPLPVKPAINAGESGSKDQHAEMNRLAYKSAMEQLLPCKNCGRTFLPDRLPVHLRSCKPSPASLAAKKTESAKTNRNSKSTSKISLEFNAANGNSSFTNNKLSISEDKDQKVMNNIPYVICYVCGKKYGSASIKIHEPQCLKKWELENAALPPQQRRKTPIKPVERSLPTTGKKISQSEWEAANEQAWQSAQAQLIPCPNCGRTFLSDRLPVHLRSCKPKH